jgi:hypothetical protein
MMSVEVTGSFQGVGVAETSTAIVTFQEPSNNCDAPKNKRGIGQLRSCVRRSARDCQLS